MTYDNAVTIIFIQEISLQLVPNMLESTVVQWWPITALMELGYHKGTVVLLHIHAYLF